MYEQTNTWIGRAALNLVTHNWDQVYFKDFFSESEKMKIFIFKMLPSIVDMFV